MSQLTLADVIAYVGDFIPSCPQSKIVRKLNLVLEEIHEEVAQIEWSTFTTRARVTTGTVAVTNGSASATFTNAVLTFPNTDSLVLCRIDPDGTWFVLTPSSTTVAALSSAYAGATDAAASYTIVYPLVVFPGAVGEVISMQTVGYPKLDYATRDNAAMRSEAEIVGRPLWYAPYDPDPTATPDDSKRVVLTPFPDLTYSFNYSYRKRPTLLAVDAATTTKLALSSAFNRAVQFGTLAYAWSQEDDGAKFGEWYGRYQKALGDARKQTNTGVSPRAQSAREAHRSALYAVQYPPAPI